MKLTDSLALYWNYLQLLKPWRTKLLFSTVLTLISVCLGLIPVYLMKLLFDQVYPSKNLELLNLLLAAVAVLFILQFVIEWTSEFLKDLVSLEFMSELKSRIFNSVCATSLEGSAKFSTGDLLVRSQEDVESAENLLLETSQAFLHQSIHLLVALGVVFVLEPKVAVLILIAGPLYFLEMKLFTPPLRKIQNEQLAMQSRLTNFLKDRFSRLALIKAFSAREHQSELYTDLLRSDIRIGMRKSFIRTASLLLNSYSLKIWSVLTIWYLGTQVVHGSLTVGELVVIAALMGQLTKPIGGLAALALNWQVNLVSLRRLDELLRFEQATQVDRVHSPCDDRISLEIKNLQYKYLDSMPVLRGIDLQFSGSGLFVLAGENGNGKTTLAEIILKLRTDFSGEVRFNGKNLTQEEVSQIIAYVPQENNLLEASAMENVLLGNHNDKTNRLKAMELARTFGILQLLQDQKTISECDDLSLGQKQRIALMRAILADKPIIILDEPTASLDKEMELNVRQYLKQLSRHKMLIVITHCSEIIKLADKVLSIKDGAVFYDYISLKSHEISPNI